MIQEESQYVTVRMLREKLILPCVGKVINPGKMPRVEALIKATTYKPGYELTLVHPVQYKIEGMSLFGDEAYNMFSTLHLKCYIPDSTKPPHEPTLIQFRMVVQPHIENADDFYLQHWRHEFFSIFEEHELDEWLRHNGELVNDPHGEKRTLYGSKVEGQDSAGS